MKLKGYITALFGMILLAGGLMGYYAAGSTASLVSSSIFAFLFFLAAIALLKEYSLGLWFAVLLSIFLTLFFAYRFTLKPAPFTATMALLSLAYATFMFANKNLKGNSKG